MKAHEFAQQLLNGPNLHIVVPKVVEWDDSDDCCAEPTVEIAKGENGLTGLECDVLVISYRSK